MTLEEFDALQPGDKIRNSQGHTAEVIATNQGAHRIVWDGTAVPYTMHREGRLWLSFEVVPKELPPELCEEP